MKVTSLVLAVILTLNGCGHLKRRDEMRAADPAAVERQSLLKAYSLERLNQAAVFLREGADQDPGHESEFCELHPTDALNLMVPLKSLRNEKITQTNSSDTLAGLTCRGECARKFKWVCKSELLEYLKKNAAPIDE